MAKYSFFHNDSDQALYSASQSKLRYNNNNINMMFSTYPKMCNEMKIRCMDLVQALIEEMISVKLTELSLCFKQVSPPRPLWSPWPG